MELKDHCIIGLAMTEKEQASLHDVFHKGHCVLQTSYILQFLWRDLTSSFDIVGPYFTGDSEEDTSLCDGGITSSD